VNGDNLNHVRHEASRHFKTEKDEYLKDQINDLAENSKSKNIRDMYRGINKFMKAYQDENDDLMQIPNI
jgi:hypothetical protein